MIDGQASEQELIQACLELTHLRRRGVNNPFEAALQAMDPTLLKLPTQNDILQKEQEFQASHPNWWIVWNPSYRSYSLIPRERAE